MIFCNLFRARAIKVSHMQNIAYSLAKLYFHDVTFLFLLCSFSNLSIQLSWFEILRIARDRQRVRFRIEHDSNLRLLNSKRSLYEYDNKHLQSITMHEELHMHSTIITYECMHEQHNDAIELSIINLLSCYSA